MFRKSILLLFIFALSSLTVKAQRSKVIAANQLLENGKYSEAKLAIEEATENEKTKDWARTWYTRGLLCQVAYEKGKKENDKKLFELYPDQLYVAFDSYNKSIEFDKNGKTISQVAPRYVLLANDFLNIGSEHYRKENYKNALKAFEHALKINRSSILSFDTDTSLLYNTALSAYKSKQWEKAANYLEELDKYAYSSNVLHLLYMARLESGDTIAARQSLEEGVIRYEYDQTLVLLLTDMHFKNDEVENALSLLDSAKLDQPENPVYPFNKGVVFQRTEQYDKAIKAYKKSIELDPEDIEAHLNIGNCYYNMAVDIDEKAQTLTNNSLYRKEKARSKAAKESAKLWLEKAYKKDPLNQQIREQLNELNQFLNKQSN